MEKNIEWVSKQLTNPNNYCIDNHIKCHSYSTDLLSKENK